MQGFDKIPPAVSKEMKIKDSCRRPHLSTDRNHFRADTTSLLGKHLRQVSKKSDQWSRRRCDNEKKVYGRTAGRMDGGWYTKNLPQNLIPNVTALQVLKHVKLISLKQADCFM